MTTATLRPYPRVQMIKAAYHDLESSQHVKRVWKSPGVMATGEPAPPVDAGPLRTISFGVAALRNLTDVPGVHQQLMDSGAVPVLLSMLKASKRISDCEWWRQQLWCVGLLESTR